MQNSRVVRFSVKVPCKIPFSSDVKEYDDCGIIILPDNYSENGLQTRLVINCHGAGGTVSTDDSQVEQQILTQYLVANGFAVMDVNGLPDKFAEEFGVNICNNIGGPIAMKSYQMAYRYCMETFNFMREVIVIGGSMGGITSTNLVLTEAIPVIAHAALCPVLDTYNQMFLHPWGDDLPKTALGVLYGFEKDAQGQWIYDEDKVQGLNPVKNPKRKNYPCPLFFIHCSDDPVVSAEITQTFMAQINASGGSAELLLLPTGGHEPQLVGEPISKPSGIDELDGVTLEIKPAVESVFNWICTHCR